MRLLFIRRTFLSSRSCVENQGMITCYPRIALLQSPDRLTDLDIVLEPTCLNPPLNFRDILQERPSCLMRIARSFSTRSLLMHKIKCLTICTMNFDTDGRLLLKRIAR